MIKSILLIVIFSILGISLLKLGYDWVVDFQATRRLKKELKKYIVGERKEDDSQETDQL